MKIGFIGLGIMGKPMVRNLLKAGYEVQAYDIVEASVKAVAESGAIGCASIAEAVRGCPIVITMLPNSPHVKAAVLGEYLGKGFGNAPADVAGFLVHVPHQTPDDVAGFLNMFIGHAGNGFPERGGRAIGRLAAEGQTGKQGAHQLTGGDFVQLLGKIVPSRLLQPGADRRL